MYQIVSDGSCDLSLELVDELKVEVIPFYVSKDGVHHLKEIKELGIREFYQFMIDNPKVYQKTSMPSIQDYLEVFEPLAKQGKDIICICISPSFSGSFNAARNAKAMILDDYPNTKIEIIDSGVATALQGMLVEEAIAKQKQNANFEECVDFINTIKDTGRIFFTVGTLEYLIHGGRVSKVAGMAAGAIGVKPLILVKEGEIINCGVAHGRKKSKHKVIEQAITYLKENDIDITKYRFCVGYGYDGDEIVEFREEFVSALKEAYPTFNEEVPIRQIGATIGVHTGPQPIGIGCIKKA